MSESGGIGLEIEYLKPELLVPARPIHNEAVRSALVGSLSVTF